MKRLWVDSGRASRGAPAGTPVINIAPGDGESGFFETTFDLPSNVSGIQLTGSANVDNVGRVFVNGNAITPSIFSNAPGLITLSGNATFSTSNASFFHAGVNTLLIAASASGDGASGAAFFATVTYGAGTLPITVTIHHEQAPDATTTSTMTVNPAITSAYYFTLTTPAAATTGNLFDVTVTAFDHFGNIATAYSGTVKLTSTDPAAPTLMGSYTFTTGAGKDNGVHTFSATLKTGGSQTITATDTSSTNPAIVGTSSAIAARGLTVSAFTPTPTGFTVSFSTPFVPANISLWGGTVVSPIQDVTLIGDKSGPVNGSLIIDPTNTTITFKASAIFLSTFFQSTVLPNDTWHVTLITGSGSGGFMDGLGAGLGRGQQWRPC